MEQRTEPIITATDLRDWVYTELRVETELSTQECLTISKNLAIKMIDVMVMEEPNIDSGYWSIVKKKLKDL